MIFNAYLYWLNIKSVESSSFHGNLIMQTRAPPALSYWFKLHWAATETSATSGASQWQPPGRGAVWLHRTFRNQKISWSIWWLVSNCEILNSCFKILSLAERKNTRHQKIHSDMKETTNTHEKTKNWNKKTKPTVPYPTVDGFQSPHTLNTDQGTTSAPRSQLPSTTHLSVEGANQRNYEETCWWNHGRLARKIQCFHSLSSVFGTPLLFLFFSAFRLCNSCFLSSSKKSFQLV